MIAQLRVGIPILGGKHWLGGVSLVELHVTALSALPKSERPQLFLVITDDSVTSFDCYRPFADKFDGLIYLGGNLSQAQNLVDPVLVHCISQDDLFEKIDLYFPVCFEVMPGRPAISWIPDFQHKYLPEFFAPEEITARNERCRRIAEYSRFIYCTSRAVEKDFRRFYPHSQAITKVLALRVSPDNDWYTPTPSEVQERYGLPDRFVLCSDQFWMHKNHRRLFAAIALLRHKGEKVHLACTGLTHDCRQPGYFPGLLQYLEEQGIKDFVHILGAIPRSDQIQLIRRSLFVIQPSLFEGLSLIVQECRALGKTIVLSDIDVHVELAYGIFFDRSDVENLVQKMSYLLAASHPGPDLRREAEAKMQATELTKAYAQDFCELVQNSHQIFHRGFI